MTSGIRYQQPQVKMETNKLVSVLAFNNMWVRFANLEKYRAPRNASAMLNAERYLIACAKATTTCCGKFATMLRTPSKDRNLLRMGNERQDMVTYPSWDLWLPFALLYQCKTVLQNQKIQYTPWSPRSALLVFCDRSCD